MYFRKKPNFTGEDLNRVIEACLSGDVRAQRILIRQHASFAKRICQRFSAQAQEKDEILSECFLKVFTHLKKYDPKLPFKAWLRTIVVHTAIDYFRKNQKVENQISIEEVEVADCSDAIHTSISAQEILDMIQQLPLAYRLVFTLFAIEGYSHQEIAALLSIQEGTSRSNLRDARRKLKRMLKLYNPSFYQQYTWHNQRYKEN